MEQQPWDINRLDGGPNGGPRLTALPRRRIVNSRNVGEAMRPHASLSGLANRLQRTKEVHALFPRTSKRARISSPSP